MVKLHDEEGKTVMDLALNEEAALANVIAAATNQGAQIITLQKREPTLEDVFVRLVGQRMEEVEHGNDASTD